MPRQVKPPFQAQSDGVDWGNERSAGPRKVNVMRAGRFWGRGRPETSEEAVAGEPAHGGALAAADRCDRCGARAYVRVLLHDGLELLFCAHHARQHASALEKIAVEIQDQTYLVARVAA